MHQNHMVVLIVLLVLGPSFAVANPPQAQKLGTDDVVKLAVEKLGKRLESAKETTGFLRAGKQEDDKESLLCELIRIGGPHAERLLSKAIKEQGHKLQRAEAELEQMDFNEDPEEWSTLSNLVDSLSDNLEMLTALRRIQKKPDPLAVEVKLPKNIKATTRQLPKFHVSLRSSDAEKIPLWITEGGDYRSGRQARWLFEVRDAEGKLLPIRQLEGWIIGGGIYTQGFLKPGETWETDLDMNSYVRIPKPGEYTVRILYHDSVTIVDSEKPDDLKNLIVFASTPFPLKVVKHPKRVILLKPDSRRKAAALIERLEATKIVKVVSGPYNEGTYDFIDPKSPQGQLLLMGWQAVPSLLDAVSDKTISPQKRAWLFSLLFTINGEEEFDPTRDSLSGVIADYEIRDGAVNWEKSSGGTIDIAKQQKFAKKWLEFRQEYLDIRKE